MQKYKKILGINQALTQDEAIKEEINNYLWVIFLVG